MSWETEQIKAKPPVEGVIEEYTEGGNLVLSPTSEAGGTLAGLAPLFELCTRMPRRDQEAKIRAAERVGERLGKSAMYSFKVGGARAEGLTIEAALALGGEWERMALGVEVAGERQGSRQPLVAMAIDLQRVFITRRPFTAHISKPSGGFDKDEDQRARWEAMQESVGASKALRKATLDNLPRWFRDPAERAARKDIAAILGGAELPDAIAKALEFYGRKNVPLEALEHFLGAERVLWTATDVANLRTLAEDIKAGLRSPEAILAGWEAYKARRASNGDGMPGGPA